jgi:SAM-dependent methyltransferase
MQTLWDLNAAAYHSFCATHTLYRETSRALVELAALRPGMSVVDLGCGTGATTAAIAEKLEHTGSVFAVDISCRMLEFARAQAPSDCVRFIHSPAEDLDRAIDQRVDRVLSNFAFFQFGDKKRALAALAGVLKPGGLFVFNSAAGGFECVEGASSDLVLDAILEEMKAAGLCASGLASPVLERREIHLDNFGLRLLDLIPSQLTISVREVLAFYRIPCVGSFLLGIPEEQLNSVLSAVASRLEGRENDAVLCNQTVALISRTGE